MAEPTDDAASTVSMLESNAISIEALEKAAQFGSSMDQTQVFRALSSMASYTTSAEMWCRVGMMRAARKMIRTNEDVESFERSNFDLLTVRTLEGANNEAAKQIWDRLQAFKLVIHIMQIGQTPRSLVMALVAMAKPKIAPNERRMQCQVDDPLRVPSLRALQVLLVSDPSLCSRCNGVKVLIDAVLDPALGSDLCDTLLLTVISALTHPKSRAYFRADDEIQRILAPFTDLDELSQEQPIYLRQETKITKDDKFRSARRAVLLLCQSTAGIGLLSSAKFGLRDVFNLLGDASTNNKCVEAILEVTAEILDPIFLELQHETSSATMGTSSSDHKLHMSAHSGGHVDALGRGGGALGEYSELEQRIRATQQALITAKWQNAADIALESKGSRKFGNLVMNLTSLKSEEGVEKDGSIKKTLSQRLSALRTGAAVPLPGMESVVNLDSRTAKVQQSLFTSNADASSRPFDLMRSISAFTVAAMIHVGLLESLINLAVCENVKKNQKSSEGRSPYLRQKGAMLAVSLRDACLELLPRELCLSLTSLKSTFDIVAGSSSTFSSFTKSLNVEENLTHQSKAMHASKLIHALANRHSFFGSHCSSKFITVNGGEVAICVPGTSNAMDGINFTVYQCGFGIGTGWNLCHAISLYRRCGIHRLPLHAKDFRWGELSDYVLDEMEFEKGATPKTPQRNASLVATAPSPSGTVSSFFRLNSTPNNSTLPSQEPMSPAPGVGESAEDDLSELSGGELIVELHALAVESKVNETKEWVRWDWKAIWAILDHCLSRRSAVCELLGLRSSSSRRLTKWAQRIGGFYRCDLSEGKAFFASLPWSADNMRFLHCASRFYCALLHCPEGRNFMVNDRRGAVFKDILLEVDRVVRRSDAERRGSSAPKSTPTLGSKMTSYLRESLGNDNRGSGMDLRSSEDEYSLFGRASVQETMAREYFTLLLHATCTAPGAQFLLDILVSTSPHSTFMPPTQPHTNTTIPLPAAADAFLNTTEGDDLPGAWTVFQGVAASARFPELDYLTKLMSSNLNYDGVFGWPRRLMECWVQGCVSEDLAVHLAGVLSVQLGNTNEASQFCFAGTASKSGELNKKTWTIDQLVKLLIRAPPSEASPFEALSSTPLSNSLAQYHLAPVRLRNVILTSLHAAAVADSGCASLMAGQVAPVCTWLLRGGGKKQSREVSRVENRMAHRLLVCLLGVLPASPSISLEAALFGVAPTNELIEEQSAVSEEAASPKSFAEECIDEWLGGIANAYPIAVQRSVAEAIGEGNRRAAAATHIQSVITGAISSTSKSGPAPSNQAPTSRFGGGSTGSNSSKEGSWVHHYFDHNTAGDRSLLNAKRVKGYIDPMAIESTNGSTYGVAVPLGMLVQPASTDHKGSSREFTTFVSQPSFGVPVGVTFTPTDIEALMRLPWSMSVALTDMEEESHELRVSTSIDATSLVPFLSSHSWGATYDAYDISSSPEWNTQTGKPSDPNDDRLFVVRGTLVDEVTGKARPIAISTADDLSASLMLGIDDILSNGKLKAPIPVEEAEGRLSQEDVGDDMAYPASFYNDDEDDMNSPSSLLSSECKSTDRDNFKVTTGAKSAVVVPGQSCRWHFVKSNTGELMLTVVEFLVSLRDVVPYSRPAPPHVLAQLARTEPGQELLCSRKVVPNLLQTAFPVSSGLSTSLKPPDPHQMTREAAIWAIGCIATSEAGLALLTSYRAEVMRDLQRGATSDDCDLLIRHTFFLAANLCSTTNTATRILQTYGWDSGANSRAAVMLPQDPTRLFRQKQMQFEGSPALHRFSNILSNDIANPLTNVSSNPAVNEATEASMRQVKDSISNLACGLTASEGKDKLLAMQRDFALAASMVSGSTSTAENKDDSDENTPVSLVNVFTDAKLYVEVFRTILSGHHFNVDQRRLVHHLFRNSDFGGKEKV